MDVTAPPQYEQLLDRVLTALKDGSVAVARRHLVKARATFEQDDLRGAILALDLVCADSNDDEQDALVRDLQSRTAAESPVFLNAVGCTLSDTGARLGEARFLE